MNPGSHSPGTVDPNGMTLLTRTHSDFCSSQCSLETSSRGLLEAPRSWCQGATMNPLTTSGGGEGICRGPDKSPHRPQESCSDPGLSRRKKTSLLRPQHCSAPINPQQKLLSPSWGMTAHTAGRHLGRDIKPRCCKPWQGCQRKCAAWRNALALSACMLMRISPATPR
jgi:hypothetical protein